MYIKTAKVLEAPNDHISTHRGRWGKKDLLGSEAEDKRGKDFSGVVRWFVTYSGRCPCCSGSELLSFSAGVSSRASTHLTVFQEEWIAWYLYLEIY